MTETNGNAHRSAKDPDIEAITRFKQAVEDNNPEAVNLVLQQHPGLVARIDEPWFAFDTPAIVHAASRGSRQLVEVLLQYGADIHVKSSWWAGGFGVLHHEHHDLSRYLIERGAQIDPHAAAALGMLDKLQAMVEDNPDAVNQPGPDGQVPLHAAASAEVIDFLLDHGADIDQRDVDHNSTPAQYAVRHADKCRHLLARGARPDMFMACMLGDMELVRRLLQENPDALQVQVGKGAFTAPGGHMYAYHIGEAAQPLFLAERLGHREITELMLAYSPLEQQFLLACMRADTETVHRHLREHPNFVESLQPGEMGILADAAGAHRADAVRLMLEVGFPADVRRDSRAATALHHAAVQGDVHIVRLLVEHGAALDARNAFGGTPLNSCMWGSVHIRNPRGDYEAVAVNLLEAGAPRPEQAWGSEGVKDVLRRYGARE